MEYSPKQRKRLWLKESSESWWSVYFISTTWHESSSFSLQYIVRICQCWNLLEHAKLRESRKIKTPLSNRKLLCSNACVTKKGLKLQLCWSKLCRKWLKCPSEKNDGRVAKYHVLLVLLYDVQFQFGFTEDQDNSTFNLRDSRFLPEQLLLSHASCVVLTNSWSYVYKFWNDPAY